MNTPVMTGYNPVLPLAGRALVGALFAVDGIMKAMSIGGTAAYMARLGFPAPELMAYLSTVVSIAGGALLVIGWQTRPMAWLLAIYVLIALGAGHRFWEYEAAQRGNQIHHFLKNLAIIGALLYIAAFGPGRSSVDKR